MSCGPADTQYEEPTSLGSDVREAECGCLDRLDVQRSNQGGGLSQELFAERNCHELSCQSRTRGSRSIFMPIKVVTRLLVNVIHNFANPVDQDESRHRRRSLDNKYNWRTVFK